MARVAVLAGLASSLVNFRGPMIEELIAAGHEVHAAAPPADPRTAGWLAERGVRFHEIRLARAGLSPTADLRTLWSFVRLFRSIAPDAVIGYTIKPVIYGTLAARIAGVPRRYAMITGLGYAFTEGRMSAKRSAVRALARTLYRTALSQAHVVIFQNDDDRADFKAWKVLRLDARTVVVNGSGVDTKHFAPAPLPPAPRFLMISRLVADKGVVEFVEAARAARSKIMGAEFHLVGPEDPNPAALPPGLIERAVADGVIAYHGEVEDVRPSIAAASVYVLPSYREGTPRSVLEAMAMGRPVITTDAPGCRATTVHGETGLLVPVGSAPALAEAMATLGADASLRDAMGRAGRARAVERYDATTVARSIVGACGL